MINLHLLRWRFFILLCLSSIYRQTNYDADVYINADRIIPRMGLEEVTPLYSVSMFVNDICNYRCLYCYRHIGKGEMSEELCFKILAHLRKNDFSKISFAGGEPTLVRWNIYEAIKYAKELGFVTELITNGTNGIDKEYIGYLDVISFDVDTLNPDVCSKLGKRRNHVENVANILEQLYDAHIKVKINTVVTRYNLDDVVNIAYWIKKQPKVYRWKVFQFLPSEGFAKVNEDALKISKMEFDEVIGKISALLEDWKGQLLYEDNNYMANGYASIDPTGYFYSAVCKDGKYETIQTGRVLDTSIDEFLNNKYLNKEVFLMRSETNHRTLES